MGILSEQDFITAQRKSGKEVLHQNFVHDPDHEEAFVFGATLSDLSSLGDGTNKLVSEFEWLGKKYAAVIILNKNDNPANGINADEALSIVGFYQILGSLLNGNMSQASGFLRRNHKILNLTEADLSEINQKITQYNDNIDDYKKIRESGVRFGIADIMDFYIMTAPDRTGGVSEKLLYTCSVIDGRELKPNKDGSFDLEESKAQASSYSSLTIFIDSFFPPQVLNKIFGSKAVDASGVEIHDPYHPQILKDKVNTILASEDYQYNLGVGVHLNIEGYEKGSTKEAQERIINEKVADLKSEYSRDVLVSTGKLHAKFLSDKIDELTNYYNKLKEICTEGFVHGDTWHDNQKKNSEGVHLIFDLEEAGCGLHILDVAIQISDKGGIDEKTGKLNELGKAIFETAEENFKSKGKSIFNEEGQKLSPEQKEEALLKATAITSTYIEIMRAFKYADGLYTKRNSFEQGIRSEIAMDGVGDNSARKFITFSQLQNAFSPEFWNKSSQPRQ